MGSSETHTILQRKASVGRQEHQARAVTVAKALRLTIARIADEMFDLSMSVIGIVTEKRDLDGCGELLEDSALLAALDGPDRARGAIVIGADIVGGLIQQQTMSRVSAPTGDPRKMTSTDAAMCAPFVDAVFTRVPPQLEVESEKQMMAGFCFGQRADEPRILSMWLEAAEFHVIRLTLDMEGGARQGQLTLILPVIEKRSTLSDDPSGTGADETASSPATLSDAVLAVPADLRIVLCHLTLSLAAVEGLKTGQTVALPHNAFPDAQITTMTGRVIGTGTVGQVNGVRAMRLKPQPVYATQPRRRASDLVDLDLPEIQALPGKNLQSREAQATQERRSADRDQGYQSAAGIEPGEDDFPGLADLNLNEDIGEITGNAPLATEGLPELTTVSGTVDTPEIASALPEPDMLPELDDLPDLASLPDLAELTGTG